MPAKSASYELGTQDYREGGLLRLLEARRLYDEECWVGAIYLAGRAAESILRALLLTKTNKQESGHDLRECLKQVRLLIQFHPSDEEALDDAVNELAIVWRNDLRFTGVGRLKRLLDRSGRLRRIGNVKVKGDPLKANARAVLAASERIVTRGEPYAKATG